MVETGAAIVLERAGDTFFGAERVVQAEVARFAAQASPPMVRVPAGHEGLGHLAVWGVTTIGVGEGGEKENGEQEERIEEEFDGRHGASSILGAAESRTVKKRPCLRVSGDFVEV